MNLLTAFGIGVVCAVMSSAPVGPINFAIMQATWGRGKRAAMQIGMGGAIADVAYAVVAWFIADIIVDNEDPAVFKWLNFLTIPVVLYLGWKMIKNRKKTGQGKNVRASNNVFLGVALGISNPGLLIYWLGAIAYATSGGWLGKHPTELSLFALGVAGGVFSCFLLVIWLTGKLTANMNAKFQSGFSLFIGLGFLAFGVFLIARAFTLYIF